MIRKRMTKKVLCIFLATMLGTVTGCGNSAKVAGLGSLEMEDKKDKDTLKENPDEGDKKIGTLGGNKGDSDKAPGGAEEDGRKPSGEPDATPTPKPTKEPDKTPTPKPTKAPDPTPTPKPTKAPDPTPVPDAVPRLETEKYSNDVFRMTIPKGWKVKYAMTPLGNNAMNIGICAEDPYNANNRLVFVVDLEPYFTSVADKKAALPYLPSYMEWAPVLKDGNPTAENIMREWSSIYTIAQIEGVLDTYFLNWLYYDTIDTTEQMLPNGAFATSCAAAATVPGSDDLYLFYIQAYMYYRAASVVFPETYASAPIMIISYNGTQATAYNTQVLSDCLCSIEIEDKYLKSGYAPADEEATPEFESLMDWSSFPGFSSAVNP